MFCNKRLTKALLIFSAANVLTGAVYATAINSTSTDIRVNPGAFDTGDTAVTQAGPVFSMGTLTTTFDPGTGIGDSDFYGLAKASADYGLLKTYVTTTLTNYQAESYSMQTGPNSFTETSGGDPVNADASFTDFLTITGGTGIGYAVIHFTVEGNTDLTTGLNGLTTSQGALLVQAGSDYVLNSGFRGGTNHLATSLIQFTYGTPFTLFVQDSAFVATLDYDTTNSPYDLQATADFYDTVTLDNLGVFSDSNGQNPVNASVTSGSNTQYDVLAAGVPEPATWFLSLAALGLLAVRRRRTA